MSGRLFVVGIGPGGAEYLTPRAAEVLQQCSDWVGYEGYLRLLSVPHPGVRRHPFPIGAERLMKGAQPPSPEARLTVTKRRSRRATCAVAGAWLPEEAQ